MKKFLAIITGLVLLLTNCSPPVEEGVYFEINGKSYQTHENVMYGYSTTTAGSNPNIPMRFNVSYTNSAFTLSFHTYSFNPGIYQCNEPADFYNTPVVKITLDIYDSEIGSPDNYQTTLDEANLGEDHYVEIIRFNESVLEIKFNVIVKPNYPGVQIVIKNGYLKLFL